MSGERHYLLLNAGLQVGQVLTHTGLPIIQSVDTDCLAQQILDLLHKCSRRHPQQRDATESKAN
jgi:hypothetical protein